MKTRFHAVHKGDGSDSLIVKYEQIGISVERLEGPNYTRLIPCPLMRIAGVYKPRPRSRPRVLFEKIQTPRGVS